MRTFSRVVPTGSSLLSLSPDDQRDGYPSTFYVWRQRRLPPKDDISISGTALSEDCSSADPKDDDVTSDGVDPIRRSASGPSQSDGDPLFRTSEGVSPPPSSFLFEPYIDLKLTKECQRLNVGIVDLAATLSEACLCTTNGDVYVWNHQPDADFRSEEDFRMPPKVRAARASDAQSVSTLRRVDIQPAGTDSDSSPPPRTTACSSDASPSSPLSPTDGHEATASDDGSRIFDTSPPSASSSRSPRMVRFRLPGIDAIRSAGTSDEDREDEDSPKVPDEAVAPCRSMRQMALRRDRNTRRHHSVIQANERWQLDVAMHESLIEAQPKRQESDNLEVTGEGVPDEDVEVASVADLIEDFKDELRNKVRMLRFSSWRKLKGLGNDTRIIQVSCGGSFSLAVSEEGSVFSWGKSRFGALGLGRRSMRQVTVTKPTRVKTLANVGHVSCGFHHAIAAFRGCTARAASWGCALDGRLGDGRVSVLCHSSPISVDFTAAFRRQPEGSAPPMLTAAFNAIIDWWSNGSPTAATEDSDTDFSSSMLAGRTSTRAVVVPVPTLGHSLQQQGQAYHQTASVVPRFPPSEPPRIASISCGDEHTLLISSDHRIFSFGSNTVGQLGRGRHVDANQPGVVNIVDPNSRPPHTASCHPLEIGIVSCGPYHNVIVLRETGSVLTWGYDVFSFHEDPSNSVDPKFSDGCIWFPHLVQDLDNHDIVEVSSGAHFSIFVTSCCNSSSDLNRDLSSSNITTDFKEDPSPPSPPKVQRVAKKSLLVAAAERLLRGTPTVVEESSPANHSPPAISDFRPPHLPPKSSEEVAKHRQEVETLERRYRDSLRHLARVEAVERETEILEKRRQERREVLWRTEILPVWAASIAAKHSLSPRISALWRLGLPPAIRKTVWPLAIGNVLKMTPQLFAICQKQADEARAMERLRRRREAKAKRLEFRQSMAPNEESQQGGTSGSDDSAAEEEELVVVMLGCKCEADRAGNSVASISFDLPRTFPQLVGFSARHQSMCKQVLEAWTFYRPDVGYVQGMSFLAATLVLTLERPYASFLCLCNLLNTPSLLGLYHLEPHRIQRRYQIFEDLLRTLSPRLHLHMDAIGLSPELFLLEWFLTLFSKPLSLEVATAVWDLFLLDGENVLYAAAVSILQLLEPQLLGKGFEEARMLLGKPYLLIRERSKILEKIAGVRRRMPSNTERAILDLERIEFSPLVEEDMACHRLEDDAGVPK